MITEADFAKFDPTQKVVSLKDISVGCDQFVFLIETTTAKYIAKRPKEEPVKVRNELTATSLLAGKGIPIPTVLYHDETMLIESFLEGHHLTENEPLSVYKELGKFVKIMHSVKIPRFGSITSAGVGTYTTEKEHIRNCIDPLEPLYKTHPMLSSINVSAILLKNEPFFDSSRSVLVHADVKNDNVLTDGHKVTGIVDFGDLVAAAPEYDLGWYFINVEKSEVWDSFIEGYGKDYVEIKVKLYSLIFNTWHISVNRVQKDSVRYKRYMQIAKELS